MSLFTEKSEHSSLTLQSHTHVIKLCHYDKRAMLCWKSLLYINNGFKFVALGMDDTKMDLSQFDEGTSRQAAAMPTNPGELKCPGQFSVFFSTPPGN